MLRESAGDRRARVGTVASIRTFGDCLSLSNQKGNPMMPPYHARRTAPRFHPMLLLSLSLALALTACGDDTTRPPTETFSVAVTVARPDGTPVEGLDVVAWNMSSSLAAVLQDDALGRRAVTRIPFVLAAPGRCWLQVTNLEGAVVSAYYDGNELPAGTHSVRVGADIEYRAGVEVYRYELVVRDPVSGTERFRAARWMTAVHLDRTRLVLPTTDASGRVVFDDPTLVPGLFDLGPMQAMDESGSQITEFTLGDSLIVRAFDAEGRWAEARSIVSPGTNSIRIEWAPPVPRASLARSGVPIGVAARVPGPELEDRLDQNSPNPFN